MSFVLALALIQGAPATVVTGPEEPEIVVIAKKLKNWCGNWKVRKGQMTCKTTRSTGDGEIDAIGCSAILTCYGPQTAQIQAIVDAKDKRDAKNARLTALFKETLPCITAARNDGIAALGDRRAGQ